ncbi:MAG: NAD(P)-binding domain-containing protein [Haliea sp.]|jgi:4-hydroxyacetophenone monooxygenase|nr:NAD(P)-binding domain-containing protein [Haliea sp.]
MNWSVELKDISDQQLEQALSLANIPALMATLVHFHGSCEHLRGDIRPRVVQMAEEEDGLTEEARQTARQMALATLKAYRDGGCPDLPAPDDSMVAETMQYITGNPFPQEQLELMREELNLFGEDRRRVDLAQEQVPSGYRVLVIGAGMSGVLAAIRLQEAGIDYLMVDKNPEIGGTWYENTYPGCQVDSVNHLYNYIFAPNRAWPAHFSDQATLFDYFQGVVEAHGLRAHARLATRVNSANYDERTGCWRVRLEGADGSPTEENFNAVISACGQLNIPAMPEIPGLERFAGVAFHSARWEHQHDLQGKRVGVIGTGCSATQFVPAIADQPASLSVFQRTPNWLMCNEEYHQPVTPEELWCLGNIPFYARWYRFFLYRARAMDGLLPFLYAENDWPGQPGSVGPANAELRAVMEQYIREQAGDDTALAEALIPDYPPGGKRPVLDDGSWIRALGRDNVTLVTEGIAEIEPGGIRTTDGVLHEVDIIIYGTGFHAQQFLSTLHVTGRGGRDLHQSWQGDPQAHKGITVPGFPNLYLLYGPNTNIVVGSSIVFFSECEMRYIMGCLKLQFQREIDALEVREDVCRDYNQEIDELNRMRAWGSPQVSSWYKNDLGRVSQNWPGTHFEWWLQTREPDPEDFVGLAGQPALRESAG